MTQNNNPELEKPKKKKGRPPKYDVERKPMSFYLPNRLMVDYKVFIQLKGINQNDFAINLIGKEIDKEKDKIEQYKNKTFNKPVKKERGLQKKHISFNLPISMIEDIKILTLIKGIRQCNFVSDLIEKEINKEKDKIEQYKNFMKKVTA